MADNATPTSATPSTPSHGFTRTPIAVLPASAQPAAPVAPVAHAAPAAKVDPETAKGQPSQSPEELLKALTKANEQKRTLEKANEAFVTQFEALKAELAAATEGSSRAKALEDEISDMIKKPKKFLAKYQDATKSENTLADILNGFAADDDPEDPEVIALKKRLDASDEERRKEKEEKEKEKLSEKERAAKEINDSVNAQIADFLVNGGVGQGEDPDKSRWVLTSKLAQKDPSLCNNVRLEALKFAKENELELTPAICADLISQKFDAIEKEKREEAEELASLIGLSREDRNKLTNDGLGFSLKPQSKYEEVGSQRKATGTESDFRRSLPTPTRKAGSGYQHGFTTKE